MGWSFVALCRKSVWCMSEGCRGRIEVMSGLCQGSGVVMPDSCRHSVGSHPERQLCALQPGAPGSGFHRLFPLSGPHLHIKPNRQSAEKLTREDRAMHHGDQPEKSPVFEPHVWRRPLQSLPTRISFFVLGATLIASLTVTGISVKAVDSTLREKVNRSSRPPCLAPAIELISGTRSEPSKSRESRNIQPC